MLVGAQTDVLDVIVSLEPVSIRFAKTGKKEDKCITDVAVDGGTNERKPTVNR